METFEILKQLRESKGLNKKNLSVLLGMPYSTYCNYESGYRCPDSDAYKKFSRFYNVSIDYLMGNSEITNNTDIQVLLQRLKDRPGMGILFKKLDNATAEDILKTVEFLDDLIK